MQEMEEDNLQYTSRSRRLTNTARFHSGQSQEATTPAGKTMIEKFRQHAQEQKTKIEDLGIIQQKRGGKRKRKNY